ncbi:hypothetical protein ANO14919_127840 [Xylariales sp. No.14919]|nr:hypothetical protein ANO14919_127840 [Xylariales sp. No.14919]
MSSKEQQRAAESSKRSRAKPMATKFNRSLAGDEDLIGGCNPPSGVFRNAKAESIMC